MTFALKDYQKKSLAALEAFFAATRGATTQAAVEAAFAQARREALGEAAPALPYRPLSREQPAIPQVCIRIPTGGGKTLLAAHAIEIAAREYVGTRAPLALWLVPSNTIRTQTLDALKTPGHPYREALLEHYPADRLTVLDISECEQLRAQDFGNRAIVAVGTIQTLRVDNTASRDVYAYKEAFEPHFAAIGDGDWLEHIAENDLAAQPYLTKADLGKIKRSFANLLAHYRPIVIIDEAHNARSDLSFEVFKRIRPACMIEWTATPAKEQNILYHVSAQELKAEHMVKLPIVLSPHPNWQEAVRDAVLARERLGTDAQNEAEYVRPIVLFQADAKDGEVPVEKLKTHLIETLHIDKSRIAVATGSQRELENVNLFDPACPIDFVITVEALKEGWDCSFAYVFCTVQSIRSAKDMEQLLGRVLRLPYAHRRASETLNRAYAFVCSPNTALVANQLADRLVSMGFEEMEAAQFVQPQLGDDLFGERPAIPPEAVSQVALPQAAADALLAAAPAAIQVAQGQTTMRGVLPQAAVEAALAAVPKREREAVQREIDRHQARAHAAAAPAQRGERFAPVPQLCASVNGELMLVEPDLLAELTHFSLAGLPADLPGFSKEQAERPYLIDVDRGHLKVRQDEAQSGLDLDASGEGIRREDVIRELDRRVRRDDILQADMIAWLGRAIDDLVRRGIELTYMARHANQLADAIARTLKALEQTRRTAAFQAALFGDAKPKLSEFHAFAFDPNTYPARWLFAGRWQFAKHFYPLPGELKPETDREETACAIEIDGMQEVKHWIRNLERQPETSFWLPTSTDRFYPDFVAELKDGRLLVVEYKGGHLLTGDDAREKQDIGKVWAAASAGRCLFKMVTDAGNAGKSVAAQLREALES
ncbi:MAG: DEAD/DEAH box helicase family protein [Proteobacteria bacterium]|nr:DEAD/DEAH box helicase family protein [Pseudomonadota bacterium]